MSDESNGKKVKRISKSVDEGIGIITVCNADGSVYGEITQDLNDYSEEIQLELRGHGWLQKVGDSASGKEVEEGFAAMEATNQGLVEGKWTSRKPAEQKLTLSEAKRKMESLSPEKQEAARAALANLGMSV